MTWNSMQDDLTDRERKVLEAVIVSYVETAEPAGSRTIAKRFALGVSAATVRNTMSDLEDRGYLFHPHTSAGRIPTDRAYRVYVDRLMTRPDLGQHEQLALRRQLDQDGTGIENLLKKAAQVLGLLTQELGVAVAPSFDSAVLERLHLMNVSADRILMVLLLSGGAAKTIFVEVSSDLPREALDILAGVLNERLSGLSLRNIRGTLRERLRDAAVNPKGEELLHVFVEEAESIFNVADKEDTPVVLSSAQMLADQPEFSSNTRMRTLLEITEQRDLLRRALQERGAPGLTVTIGGENLDPKFSAFTIVTSTYQSGSLSGVIGVMGPTRMPYSKVVSLVEHASRLVSDLAPPSVS
jgi:heat-inducible transcriptional repressor